MQRVEQKGAVAQFPAAGSNPLPPKEILPRLLAACTTACTGASPTARDVLAKVLTALVARLPPQELVELLSRLFKACNKP